MDPEIFASQLVKAFKNHSKLEPRDKSIYDKPRKLSLDIDKLNQFFFI